MSASWITVASDVPAVAAISAADEARAVAGLFRMNRATLRSEPESVLCVSMSLRASASVCGSFIGDPRYASCLYDIMS